MKMNSQVIKEYETLCQQLGDLICNKDKLDLKIIEIKNRIEYLNKLVLDLEYAEKLEKGSPS